MSGHARLPAQRLWALALVAWVTAIGPATVPGIPLPNPPFLVGCEAYIPLNSINLGTVFNASSCTAYPYTVAVPAGLSGVQLSFQAAGIDVNSFDVVTSEGIDATIGDF